MFALLIYGVGKTFFWPTMLAVASDRFPRTGAIAISIMGGIGMMSAGMIGGPGLGYAKDRFAAAHLEATQPAVYAQYKVAQPSGWLVFKEVAAIDGRKLGEVQGKLSAARAELASHWRQRSGSGPRAPHARRAGRARGQSFRVTARRSLPTR